MTATQVFFRFLKEEGIYNKIMPSVIETAKKILSKDDQYSKLVDFHGNKNIVIDRILKQEHSCLSQIFLLLYYNSFVRFYDGNFWKYDKAFHKFLTHYVNGGYYKCFISDDKLQFDHFGKRKYRNGYYVVDFSWKRQYDTRN